MKFLDALSTSVALVLVLALTSIASPDQQLAPPSSGRSGDVSSTVADAVSTSGDALRAGVQVAPGAKVAVRGQVPAGPARSRVSSRMSSRVSLVRRDGAGLVVVGTARVDARGRYLLRSTAPTAPGTYAYRVTLRTGRSARVVKRVRVVVATATPAPVPTAPLPVLPTGPAGDPADWTYLGGARIARWDPCHTITWSVTGASPYAEALVDLQTSFSRLATATGLTFEQVADPAISSFDVTWTNSATDSRLAGTVVGFGGNSSSARADGVSEIVSGYVLLDQEHTLPAGFGIGSSWGKVMLHEMTHAVGLGHAAGAQQLMYPQVAQTPADFGAGDLSGLRAVGASQGCLPAL